MMKQSCCMFVLTAALYPFMSFSADSLYCPAQQNYIHPGMTTDQVMTLCGQPMSRQTSSDVQVIKKTPVTQLIYTTLNPGSVYSGLDSYYTMWSLPSGSQGTSLRINVVNDKVTAVDINGTDTNVMTLFNGGNIQVGDDINKVYSVCGDPSLTNQTFINQPIPNNSHPEVWSYQFEPYQPTIHLTFINGKLQSIE